MSSNASRARIELKQLFDAQWHNGLLPHIVFNPEVADDAYFPGPDYWRSSSDSRGQAPRDTQTSGIVNPPVHASAVLNLLQRDAGSLDTRVFAKSMYAPLTRWLEYLLRERDPDGNGLVYIRHPWESGMDNSPAWDAILEAMTVPAGSIPPYNRTDIVHGDPADRPSNATYDRFVSLMICARNHSYDEARIASVGGCPFLVEDVTFNTLLAQACHDMAALALALGDEYKADAPKWASRASRTVQALGALWEAPFGMFASFDVRARKSLALHRVVGGLMPLHIHFSPSIANVSDSTLHAKALLDMLRSPRFLTRWSVPSLDALDDEFSPRNYWRGPTWMNMDWLLVRGVMTRRDGDRDASRILRAMRGLVESAGFREYWDPLNGSAHGAASFSWTAALYLDAFC